MLYRSSEFRSRSLHPVNCYYMIGCNSTLYNLICAGTVLFDGWLPLALVINDVVKKPPEQFEVMRFHTSNNSSRSRIIRKKHR